MGENQQDSFRIPRRKTKKKEKKKKKKRKKKKEECSLFCLSTKGEGLNSESLLLLRLSENGNDFLHIAS